MAFVAEDGTGLATANSLVTEEYATAYHADRGNAVWASYSVPQRRAFLIKATDYFERSYGPRLKGSRQYPDQALSFPRSLTGVPLLVKQAISEFAMLEGQGLLTPVPPNENGRWLKQRSTQVGPMTTRRVYSDKSTPAFIVIQHVEMLLGALLYSAGVVRE